MIVFLDIRVNYDYLSISFNKSEYIGKIILFLQNNNIDADFIPTDENIDKTILRDFFHQHDDWFYCFNVDSYNVEIVKDLVSEIRKKDKIILVGRYVNNNLDELFEQSSVIGFDYLSEHYILQYLLNKPKDEIPGLIYNDNGKIIQNPKIKNETIWTVTLQDSPFLEKIIPISNILIEGYHFSYGCNKNCKFCNCSYYQCKRVVKPEKIIKQELLLLESYIRQNNKQYRVEIMDEDFLGSENQNALINILHSLSLEKLYFSCQTRLENINDKILYELEKVGIKEISVGIESLSYRKYRWLKNSVLTRNEYYKKLVLFTRFSNIQKKIPIVLGVNFIFGLPNETIGDMFKTLLFIILLRNKDININKLLILKNTWFYNNSINSTIVNKKVLQNKSYYDLIFTYMMKEKDIAYKQKFFYIYTTFLFFYLMDYSNVGIFNFIYENDLNKNSFYNIKFDENSKKKIDYHNNCFYIPYLKNNNKYMIYDEFYQKLNRYDVSFIDARNNNKVSKSFKCFIIPYCEEKRVYRFYNPKKHIFGLNSENFDLKKKLLEKVQYYSIINPSEYIEIEIIGYSIILKEIL